MINPSLLGLQGWGGQSTLQSDTVALGWTQAHYLTQAGFELVAIFIFILLSPELIVTSQYTKLRLSS